MCICVTVPVISRLLGIIYHASVRQTGYLIFLGNLAGV